MSNINKSCLVILANGAEEMETVITVDVLRRAQIEVILAGLTDSEPVTCSRKVKIVPDMSLEEAVKSKYYPFHAVILPGGARGAENLAESLAVKKILQEQETRGGFIAAVCAGPTALLSHGCAKGKTITSHPGVRDRLEQSKIFKGYTDERVVQDGKIITSRGPGTCFEFALKIVENLRGKDIADSLISPMLVKT